MERATRRPEFSSLFPPTPPPILRDLEQVLRLCGHQAPHLWKKPGPAHSPRDRTRRRALRGWTCLGPAIRKDALLLLHPNTQNMSQPFTRKQSRGGTSAYMFGTGYLAESVMYSKSEVSMRIKILITYDMFYLMKTQNHLKAHVAKYYQMKIDFGIKIMISAKPICRRITNITIQ